jgi:hypothetical protein
MSEEARVFLSYQQALAMLPAGDRIHTFRSIGALAIGADWPRAVLLEAIEHYGAELTGQSARSIGYAMCIIDDIGVLFIATARAVEEES